MFGRTVDQWRGTTLGLSRRADATTPSGGGPAPVLHAISRHVLPRPTDWPPTAEITGYWFSNSDETTLSESVNSFLAAGPAPVFVGFGSMAGRDPRHHSAGARGHRTCWGACRAGTRWGRLGKVIRTDRNLVVDEVPYDLLFPAWPPSCTTAE